MCVCVSKLFAAISPDLKQAKKISQGPRVVLEEGVLESAINITKIHNFGLS